MKPSFIVAIIIPIIGVALFLGITSSPASAQSRIESVFNGHRIIYPPSSIPQPGRHHTNYFFVDSDVPNPNGPSPGDETPGSLACVYKLVTGPTGCPIATSKNVPTGGWGAIAIVDAGDYPTAAADRHAFSAYFGIPNAKIFLVESTQVNTDPTWAAVKLAANLVATAGGGVVSMSWGDPEVAQEINWDAYFTKPGVVYFAASGDSGIGVSIYPGASPNVVSVGGTHFNRDLNGNFVKEVYFTGGGGSDLSPYEPRPSYQNGVSGIVGTHRGYPDVAADYCCAAVYLNGGWISVGEAQLVPPTEIQTSSRN